MVILLHALMQEELARHHLVLTMQRMKPPVSLQNLMLISVILITQVQSVLFKVLLVVLQQKELSENVLTWEKLLRATIVRLLRMAI